jgi:hypothetical protein
MARDTPFPAREDAEDSYSLSRTTRSCSTKHSNPTIVETDDVKSAPQRVKWWSAQALLRSIAISRGRAATLRNRAAWTIRSPMRRPTTWAPGWCSTRNPTFRRHGGRVPGADNEDAGTERPRMPKLWKWLNGDGFAYAKVTR